MRHILRATLASDFVSVFPLMTLAQIGPLTSLFEATATAVGAGIVLLGTAAGISGLAQRKSRQGMESRALVGGYLGGGVGAVLALVDLILRYGVSK